MVELIFNLIQNLSVIIASIVAIYGIHSWKRKIKYKKKFELAEEVLSAFYATRDAIHRVRFPVGSISEGKLRIKSPNESKEDEKNLDRAYITIARLENESGYFTHLNSLKFRFETHFGSWNPNPFDEIHEIRREISFAADQLGRKFWNEEYMKSIRNSCEIRKIHWAESKLEEFESTIWANTLEAKQDIINERINNAINSVESTCLKYVKN